MGMYILITVLLASGATEEIRLETMYETRSACEAAIAEVEKKYKEEHKDVRVERVECRGG